MSKKITATLSISSIRAAQKALQEYRDSLAKKCELFVEKLSEFGISTGKTRLASSSGTEEREMAQYVTFSTSLEPTRHGAKAVMIATSGIIKSEWRTADGTKSSDVSPMLMVEFGSGLRANNEHGGKHGMGQGTFPGQTHAFDQEGWWYQSLDGEWHHSYGISPAMPMYHASMEMRENIMRIANEVFES